MSGFHEITFACGHTERVHVDGNLEQQKQEVSHLERWACSKCRKRRSDNQVASESVGLPTLIGSEKQVLFANRLRLENINLLKESIKKSDIYKCEVRGISQEDLIKEAKEKGGDQLVNIVLEKIKRYNDSVDAFKKLETEESAVWIIEHYQNA